MSKSNYRSNREEIQELLRRYEDLKSGKSKSFLEEERFEQLIDYFDDQDKLSDALQAAELAVGIFPYSSALMLKKADLLLVSRRYTEALETLEHAALLDSNDIHLYILKTDAFLALDQQENAVMLLEEAVQHFEGEDRLELLFELADVYDDYEAFDKVFDCLKLILEEDPLNEEALYKICFWTDFTGRNEESIRVHQQIINAFPYSELAWFNLGAAYQGLKLHEKAIDAYMYAVAIDEKFDYAYRNMGDAYIRLRRYKDAIEMLEKVLELSRPEEVIHEAIGYCYDRMGQFAQARFHYRKASHMNPGDAKLHYKVATTYINEKQYEQAIKQLRQALKIHRLQPDFNHAMGICMMETNRYKEAVEYYAQVLRMRPKNVKGWTALLNCLLRADMLEEAEHFAAKAFEQTGGKPIFIFYRSAIYFSMGKVKEAINQLEKGMEKAPKLVKNLIQIHPGILRHPQVVDILARHKRSRRF